jgi:hypothetical protein
MKGFVEVTDRVARVVIVALSTRQASGV